MGGNDKVKSIILAAGYGTRLGHLTENTPKPLLKVAGKPIVEHIIKKIEKVEEVDEIFIVTNNKFYNNFEEWLKNFKSTKKIKIINDQTTSNDNRLGSLGDINFVIEQENIKESALIVAGDNLFEFPLKDFVESRKKRNKSAIALYDVQDIELAKHYGIVGVENNIVVNFEEKPNKPKSTLVSTGVYTYPPYILPIFKEFVERYGDGDKVGNFLEWLHKREQVYCYVTKEKWFDIGNFEQLEKARKEFKS